MATIKDRGIVLRETAYNEADTHLVLLLKERGKLVVSAKGARKPKSKLNAAAQPFVYAEFVLFEGDGFYSLASAEVIESFYRLREDFARYCHAAYFLELADRFLLREMDVREPLRLILRGLQALARGVPGAELVSAIFTYKFLQLEGYSPVMDACAFCGGEIGGGKLLFAAEGLCCADCLRAGEVRALRIDETVAACIRSVLDGDADGLFRVDAEEDVRLALAKTARLFREANVEKSFKSLTMLYE